MSIPRIVKNLFIGGEFVNSISGRTFDVFNPADESRIASIQRASSQDIDHAVQAARYAFDEGPWRRMDPTDRADCMFKLAKLIKNNSDDLATLETINNGQISYMARGSVSMLHDTIKYYAGYTDKIRGHTIPTDGPFFSYTKKQPVGVVGQIIPWNVPLIMLAWKIAPALAAGCTIVLKTAEQTPLTALRVAELIKEAGFPKGVVNIVSGFGDVGQYLCKHPGVDKVAFTGSVQVGYDIMRNSHIKNLKRITLQLGGKSPNIITKNANMQIALNQSIFGVIFNSGQVCIAGSRIYVHSSIYDQFIKKSSEIIKSTKVGNPFDPQTVIGPLISKQQQQRVLGYIESGQKEGAKLMAGGKRYGSKGFFVEPTLFADVNDDMLIAREQIFGPVMSVLKFENNDEVIKRANNTMYGLGAGIVSDNVEQIQYLSDRLKCGTVFVNCYNRMGHTLPFGGYKDSGIGRQMGQQGLNAYLQTKTVINKK